MDKQQMINLLINKKRKETAAELKGYEKMVKGAVSGLLLDLYNKEILGIEKKAKKGKSWESKSTSKMEK